MKYLAFVLFVATVYAANWALTHYGVVPIGLGLEAPAGVFFAGLGFLLRDALHELAGRLWVVAAILAGAILSYLLGADLEVPGGHASVAVASAAAFLLSETCDLGAYLAARRRTLTGAVAASQIIAAAVDSALFLWLAFGSLAFFWGQFAAKTVLALPVVAGLLLWRVRAAGR